MYVSAYLPSEPLSFEHLSNVFRAEGVARRGIYARDALSSPSRPLPPSSLSVLNHPWRIWILYVVGLAGYCTSTIYKVWESRNVLNTK